MPQLTQTILEGKEQPKIIIIHGKELKTVSFSLIFCIIAHTGMSCLSHPSFGSPVPVWYLAVSIGNLSFHSSWSVEVGSGTSTWWFDWCHRGDWHPHGSSSQCLQNRDISDAVRQWMSGMLSGLCDGRILTSSFEPSRGTMSNHHVSHAT